MVLRSLFVVAVLGTLLVESPEAAGQCRGGGGGQRGGGGRETFANSAQIPGLGQFPQFDQQGAMQQAAMQQAYLQQLQLQRAILLQQYALQKAQEREASRQKRLAAANARREKEAQRRSAQESKDGIAALTDNK